MMKNDEWNVKDFLYNGTTIIGFSDTGKVKFKTNKDVVLPSLNEAGQTISEIADRAFLIASFDTKQDLNIGINSVYIPDTVKVIGKEAFRYNALTSIDIPEGVTSINMLAFNGNKLESLNIPSTVTQLQNGAFTMNEITTLTLPNSIKVITSAFAFNKLTSLTIPEGTIKIENLAFSDNELTEVKLPSTLKYLSGFNNNSFKSITIPRSVEELGSKAFASNKMTSVTIPGNVKIVGKRAFWDTWHDQILTSVTFEEGVEELKEFAFRDNHLKDVNIPNSLKVIDKSTFGGNLGHDGVVHLFTLDYNNPSNLIESKDKHAINPAKIIVIYKFEDNLLKEEYYFKSDGKYFHIGDKDVKITPTYSDNKYELKNNSAVTIDLDKKENIVIFECKVKDFEEEIKIKIIGSVGSIAVDFGTDGNTAINNLSKNTFIIDTNETKHKVNLSWTVKNYDKNKSGSYEAIGSFKLPERVVQSDSETKLEVKCSIIIKERLEDSGWNSEDFIYEGVTLKGLSSNGKKKIKINRNLVLPKKNSEGKSITHIGASAFKEINIENIFIPEGILQIGTYAFFKNNLRYVDFPGTIERVESQAFAKNKLVDITFEKGPNTLCLDNLSLLGNNLTNITILKEVKKIHEDAFKKNLGHGDDSKKVHVYLSSLDPKNNGLFKNSNYHRIFSLVAFKKF